MQRASGGGAHVALRARTTNEVDQFHAAFLLDADGNNVEAVCMR